MDKLSGKTDAKMKAKKEQKDKLDKMFGKNPQREKWLFEGLKDDAFLKASEQFDSPMHQYLVKSQQAKDLIFNIKQEFTGAIFNDHHDQQFALAGAGGNFMQFRSNPDSGFS